jgi:hypothetical protein
MKNGFGGREGEDEPAVSGVDRGKLEDVTEEGAVGFWVSGVEDDVGAIDRCAELRVRIMVSLGGRVGSHPAHQVEKDLVDARVVGELGMESGGHGPSLPNGHGSFIAAFSGEDFNALSHVLDFWGADEDHFQRRIARFQDQPTLADGAVDLASVGVAADADVKGAEAFLLGIFDFRSKENGAGTGAERRLGVHELLQLLESGLAQEFQECARFAARDDETVDGVKLFGLFDEHNFGAEFFETAAVSIEITLQRQDADFHIEIPTPRTIAETGEFTTRAGSCAILADSIACIIHE